MENGTPFSSIEKLMRLVNVTECYLVPSILVYISLSASTFSHITTFKLGHFFPSLKKQDQFFANTTHFIPWPQFSLPNLLPTHTFHHECCLHGEGWHCYISYSFKPKWKAVRLKIVFFFYLLLLIVSYTEIYLSINRRRTK